MRSWCLTFLTLCSQRCINKHFSYCFPQLPFSFRCSGFSTLFYGLETSGLCLRKPAGTRVLRDSQAVPPRNKPAGSPSSLTTREALTSQGVTAPRETWTNHLNTARWGVPPPTDTKCKPCLEWHLCICRQTHQELGNEKVGRCVTWWLKQMKK